MPPALELVIARHREDLAWVRRVPSAFRITVYDKGGGGAGEPLPNQGREAHTYLHHIVARHDSPADLTVFVQGKPFDHAPDLHRVLRRLAEGAQTVADFHWLGFLADTDDARGRRLFVPWSKNQDGRELRLDDFHRRLFEAQGPDAYRFFVGAQFAVTASTLRRRTLAFYRRALGLSVDFPDAAHCFERCWDRVFGVSGTDGRLPAGQSTVYLKPVRRLGRAGAPGAGDAAAGPPAPTAERGPSGANSAKHPLVEQRDAG